MLEEQRSFSGPLQWWRSRFMKKNSRCLNFELKIRPQTLWFDSWLYPPWLREKIATCSAFNKMQSSGRSTSRVPAPFGNYDKIQKLSEEGRLKEALNLLDLMANQSSIALKDAFVCLLRGCTRRKALAEGKQVHALIVQTKCDTNTFLSNLLVDMYSNCGSVVEALKIFAAMRQRNVFSWTAMISAYVNSGQYKEALTLFQQMQKTNIEPNKVTFVVLLKACTSSAFLKQGQQLHTLISKRGFDSDLIVQTSLIDMYATCGCLKDARKLFNNMAERDVISWNAMIAAYSQKGLGKEALDLYEQMKHEGVGPNSVTLLLLLKACASISALERGKELHSLILEKGFESEITIQTTLIDMYAKCGCLEDAQELFNSMRQRNVVPWNILISGYAKKGLGKEALDLYEQMKHEGVEPDNITLVLLLKACASISALERGKELHSLIVEKGFELEITIQNTLIDMYAKCGCLQDACKLFNNINQRDLVSWNTMIAGYAQKGLGKEALDLYEQMKLEGMEPSNVTVVLLLKACASISALEQGKELHALILRKGFESEITIQNALIDMYAKCGCLRDARELFNNMQQRDLVSWNAMIAGYAQKGLGKEALDLYDQMKNEAMEPDNITLVLLLKACASMSALERGKQVHSLIVENGCESEMTIQTTLIDMYAKCGCLMDARELFNNVHQRDVVSWNTMIAGYVQKGLGKEALDLYEQMKHEGMELDSISLVLLLKACASISALEQGKELHSLILEKGFESEMNIQTTLIDMYAKCGCLRNARELFNSMQLRDLVSWNTMIAGYAQKGLGKEALDLFEQMKHEGLQANEATYTCVLSACSHSCLVDEGRHVFESMFEDHGLTPTLDHYACMVDLLGRAGFLADAVDFILKMPMEPGEAVWMSLLGSARKYVHVEIGRRAFERVVESKSEEAAPYLLLIDIYSAAGMINEVAKLRKEMNEAQRLAKTFGVQLDES